MGVDVIVSGGIPLSAFDFQTLRVTTSTWPGFSLLGCMLRILQYPGGRADNLAAAPGLAAFYTRQIKQ